jgi:predicted metal-dependent hydrolase
MREKTYTIDGTDILFVKSKKAKGVNISIRPFKGVRVAVPYFVTFKSALKVVNLRIDWINKHLNKIKAAENTLTTFDTTTNFKTRDHQLKIVQEPCEYINYKITDKSIMVTVPKTMKIDTVLVQTEIRKAIENTWRKEAKELLPKRTQELAKLHGFSYQKVTIKNTKTRWGSCSFVNNINLSLHLMRLPDYLIDYVILHELVHTKVKNHSHDFWSMLTEKASMSREYDKELKNHRIAIY